MLKALDKIINPSGYGFDPMATIEDYQNAIQEILNTSINAHGETVQIILDRQEQEEKED
jgi:hypothetical protein